MNRLSTLSILLLCTSLRAQTRSIHDSAMAVVSNYISIKVNIQRPASDSSPRSGPFANFTVIDERPDTTRIGFHCGDGSVGSLKSRQLIFTQPVAREVSEYLNERAANPDGIYKALIVIRSLSITDPVLAPEMRSEDIRWVILRVRTHLRAEVYAEKDGVYIPVCRYDSIEWPKATLPEHWGRNFSSLLDGLIAKASQSIMEPLKSRKHVTLDAIREYNHTVLDIPILKEGVALSPGVYKDFDEFKRNAPSLDTAGFSTESDQLGLILYQKGPGQEMIYCHSFWGYCDGKTVYTMYDGILRPSWRNMHAWYFFEEETKTNSSSDNLDRNEEPVQRNSTLPWGHTGRKLRIIKTHVRQIDVDTGEIY